MHSYRRNDVNDGWEVFFDCGADNYKVGTVKTFRYEADAVRLVSFLNGGGDIGPAQLQILLERGS